MKRIVFTLILIAGISMAFAQTESQPPYLKTKKIPEFVLHLIPDSSKYTQSNLDKTKNTIFIYFGPECGHCMVFAKKMMDSIALFKNTQIVMVSSFDFSKIKKFYEENKIADAPIITMGQDENFFFISHFGIRQFPSAFIFSPSGRFLKSFESEIDISELSKEYKEPVKKITPKKTTPKSVKPTAKKS